MFDYLSLSPSYSLSASPFLSSFIFICISIFISLSSIHRNQVFDTLRIQLIRFGRANQSSASRRFDAHFNLFSCPVSIDQYTNHFYCTKIAWKQVVNWNKMRHFIQKGNTKCKTHRPIQLYSFLFLILICHLTLINLLLFNIQFVFSHLQWFQQICFSYDFILLVCLIKLIY